MQRFNHDILLRKFWMTLLSIALVAAQQQRIDMPSLLPTANPTSIQSATTTFTPSSVPTPLTTSSAPSSHSPAPSLAATTADPTSPKPTSHPSALPTTADPTSPKPTSHPSARPTFAVTNATNLPTPHPTAAPTALHTNNPSTKAPHSDLPTGQPTRQPSCTPSKQPSRKPTKKTVKTLEPSHGKDPTGQPTGMPTKTAAPTHKSVHPTGQPTRHPTKGAHVDKTMVPTGQPSSQPSSQPSWQPSTRPTARATNSTPPTVHPSPAPSHPPPSALPTWSLPPSPAPSVSLQPTLNTSYYAFIVLEAGAALPVVLDGEARYVTPPPPVYGLFGAPPSSSSARERELAVRRWYLSVDVWSTGFGSSDQQASQQFVTVFAGWPNTVFDAAAVNSTMAPVVAKCAPGPRCNNQWVRCASGSNIDITSLISPDGAGSIAITSVSSGVVGVPAGCERDEISKKYVVYMRYTITPDHPQPTIAPTSALAPSPPAVTAVGVLAAFTHAGAPYFAMVLAAALGLILALLISRARRPSSPWARRAKQGAGNQSDEPRSSFSSEDFSPTFPPSPSPSRPQEQQQASQKGPIAPISLLRTSFSLSLLLANIVAEGVVIFVLLLDLGLGLGKHWGDGLWSAGVAMLVARVLQCIPSGLILSGMFRSRGLCAAAARDGGPRRGSNGSSSGGSSSGNRAKGLARHDGTSSLDFFTSGAWRAEKPPLGPLLEEDNLLHHRTLYGVVLLLSLVDCSALRFFPWLESPYTRATDGLPCGAVVSAALHCKLCQVIVAEAGLFVFIAKAYQAVGNPELLANGSASSVGSAVGFLAAAVVTTTASLVACLLDLCSGATPSTHTAAHQNNAANLQEVVNPLAGTSASQAQATNRIEGRIDDLERRLSKALESANIALEQPSSAPGPASMKRIPPSAPARGSVVPGALTVTQQEAVGSLLYSSGPQRRPTLGAAAADNNNNNNNSSSSSSSSSTVSRLPVDAIPARRGSAAVAVDVKMRPPSNSSSSSPLPPTLPPPRSAASALGLSLPSSSFSSTPQPPNRMSLSSVDVFDSVTKPSWAVDSSDDDDRL